MRDPFSKRSSRADRRQKVLIFILGAATVAIGVSATTWLDQLGSLTQVIVGFFSF